jgi:hypothetical protein
MSSRPHGAKAGNHAEGTGTPSFKYPLNGGTVITVHADGHSHLRHEYVEIGHLLTEEEKK